ncbi:NAD(P)H-dependent oxidoreductase [Clostridium sp. YIM B02506]|uniref:NAD(P)H-dependent oxidoreductase n=1 Tax=Clostridium sp. YIM B02506 TaxID=2910680 RepID=UPI001EEF50E3|nr:NAD(P)H-dependent oxidoreductase [Clostridium sp. YIM B02506]
MKIIVLNGSPKGDISVTMQYIKYIQKKFPKHELNIINIAQQINKLEKDLNFFGEVIDEINLSDGVIWAFPLYYHLVASQYKRFIELIFERKVTNSFKGKYACALATSIHFQDHTAINYINAICDDLGMNFVDYLSLHMDDLEKESSRKLILAFYENYFNAINNKITTTKNYSKLSYNPIVYKSEATFNKIDTSNKKLTLITDSLENSNLSNMINTFSSFFIDDIEIINLQEIDIKGGCLGCIKCGYNYECVYTGKDEFIDFYNNKIRNSDIIIFCGDIKDRYLSSLWKRFFDRSFFNTHTPTITGKQIGFIISGPLTQIPNLKQIFESYTQWQRANLVDFVTDEYSSINEIDNQLYALALKAINLSLADFIKPSTFLGVGGMKIFRDDIYGKLRFPFLADYKAYKKLGIFDFSHNSLKYKIMSTIFLIMTKFPKIKNEIYSNQIKPGMIQKLKKIAEDPNI